MSGGVASVEAGGAERRSINLIISVESQIGGISRQELSVKAADVKTSGNPTHPAARYFYKLTFRFQSAEIILVFLRVRWGCQWYKSAVKPGALLTGTLADSVWRANAVSPLCSLM